MCKCTFSEQNRTTMTNNIELTQNNSFEKSKDKTEFKVYKRRWLILVLFILLSIAISVQYITYSVIAHIIAKYYQVSYEAVDWTSMVGAIVYVVVSIPGTYVIDKIGLRKTMIIGTIGTSLGAWIKVGSIHPDRFWLIILGQGIVAIFQICVYPILPKLAATWFGYHQISTACAIGYIGLQVGNALSFVLPPLIVLNTNLEDIERGLYIMNISYATFCTILIPLILIFFDDAPPTPPTISQKLLINERNSNQVKSFFATCKTILFIKPYMLSLIIFGINLGTFSALQILSNQIIMSYYTDADYDVGVIGLLQTLLSLIGSLGIGILLDKYKKFKITCWVLYFIYFALLIFYIGTIDQGLEFLYISSILIGICAGAIMTLGFELTAEFTYPEPEGVCMGLVSNWLTIVSLLFTIMSGYMLRSIGFIWASLTILAIIFACDLLFFFLKFDLRRKVIQDSQSKSEVSQNL